ncbi:MAG: response regulator transcription factor [Lachnospiraceae bacterium]|nr:response regulator transcription factor [Lachnospiraceae bacterium]
MHYNCLIVDDEADLAKMTCEYFELFDVSCAYVTDAAACKEFLSAHEVDLLLLDINLSEESGFALCKSLRETSDIPILFISARQSDEDVLIALNIGGDDYIKKPYTLSILLAKVKAVLKRLPGNGGTDRLYLDESIFCAFIDGRRVELKAKEFKLLQCLFENRNTIVSKERLFNEVWGDAFFGDSTLNVHIRRLREKLEKDPGNPELIKTVWGTGYLLEI